MANNIRQFVMYRVTDPPGTGAFGELTQNFDLSTFIKSFQFSLMGRPLKTVGVGQYQDARIPGRHQPLDLTVIYPGSLRGLFGVNQVYGLEITQDLTHEDTSAVIKEKWEVDARLTSIELPPLGQTNDDMDTTLVFDVLTADCTHDNNATKVVEYDKTTTPQKFNYMGASIF